MLIQPGLSTQCDADELLASAHKEISVVRVKCMKKKKPTTTTSGSHKKAYGEQWLVYAHLACPERP